jgi:hypothetical protein
MFRPTAALVMLLCSMLVGCAGGADNPCTRDDQCESGFCRADGSCAPVEEPDAATDGDDTDDDSMIDAPPSELCTPNHDGSISRTEIPLAAGKMATYRIAADASFSTTGTAAANNQRRWDLGGQLTGDADRLVVLDAPTGTWWADIFPTATYAAPLAADSDLLGVFRVDETSVKLLGVVSPEGGATRTELEYDPPATILELPVTAGATWSSTSTVVGYANGVGPGAYTERYESLVDQVGTMVTPYGEFPVVRVATDLDRTAGVSPLLSKRTFSWMAECYGSVANVSSQDFETATEFDDPAEVRRLAP